MGHFIDTCINTTQGKKKKRTHQKDGLSVAPNLWPRVTPKQPRVRLSVAPNLWPRVTPKQPRVRSVLYIDSFISGGGQLGKRAHERGQ